MVCISFSFIQHDKNSSCNNVEKKVNQENQNQQAPIHEATSDNQLVIPTSDQGIPKTIEIVRVKNE